MDIRRSYKFRIYPNGEQEITLFKWRRSLKDLHNAALQQRLTALTCSRQGWSRPARYLDQQNQLPAARAEIPWLSAVPSTCSQLVLRGLDSSWQAWEAEQRDMSSLRIWKRKKDRERAKETADANGNGKAKVKANGKKKPRKARKPRKVRKQKRTVELKGQPRYKGRNNNIAICAASTMGIVDDKHIKFPKLGKVKAVLHRQVIGRIKMCSITHDAGQWYASFSCELEVPDPGPSKKPAVGIDRGIALTIADSTGRIARIPEEVRRLDERAARIQSLGLRNKDVDAKPRSKRYERVMDRVRKVKRKARRIRDEWLHKQALYYATNFGTIYVEKLQIRNMTASAKGTVKNPGRNVRQKAGLNRSILEQGWGRFIQILKYKCEVTGAVVIEVSAKDTSITCSECGHKDKGNRRAQAEFGCLNCNHTENADINAAKVISQREGETVGGYVKKAPKKRRMLIRRQKGTMTSSFKPVASLEASV